MQFEIFQNYDIIYVKQKSKGVFIVIGLYPNETDRERSGTRAPLPQLPFSVIIWRVFNALPI